MSRKLYVLILEDTEDDALLLLRTLRQGGYEPIYDRVDNAQDFEQAMRRGQWEIIIADYQMPQFTAIHALNWLKENGPDIPFLIVSGTIGEDVAVEAMKAGAHDYFVKGKLARLMPTIERELHEAEERRERRRVEQRLHQTNRFLESMIEASPVAIAVLDPHMQVQVWNPAAEALFGWTAKELIGRTLPILEKTSPAGGEGLDLQQILLNSLRGKTAIGIETQCRRRDLSAVEVNVSTAPLSESSETQSGILAFFTDITQHKLMETQLRQSQKMEAIGQLAGGVAHDFNNLLHVILGYVSLHIDAAAAGDPRLNDLLEVQTAGTRAMELTRQLLAFSRRQVLQPVDLNVNQLISNLLKMLRRIIGEHIQLNFVAGHAIGTVHADPGQLEQVIMNLCINARDAMDEGGVLTIEAENVLINGQFREGHPWVPEGRYVLLSVSDTGIGMDTETQSRIFDPFFTTKPEGKGTGLGLSTVYGIVKQHNGFVHVYSEVGRGTTFKIYLPMVDRLASQVGNKIEMAPVGGSETILLAEDQPAVRALAARVLREAGYEVLEAADGQDAVEVFEKNADRVKLALLDVIMPKLYGRAVLEQIRLKNPRVKVLFSSGYSPNGVHTDFIASEKATMIQKPYSPKDLLKKVREVLDSA